MFVLTAWQRIPAPRIDFKITREWGAGMLKKTQVGRPTKYTSQELKEMEFLPGELQKGRKTVVSSLVCALNAA